MQANQTPIPTEDCGDDAQPIIAATHGSGPLLERDYQAIIVGASCSPEAIIAMVRSDFPRFSPDALAAFECRVGFALPLEVGHEMFINIRGAGTCHVRTVHADERSLTLRTLDGHPEAGRITFGAFNNEDGELVVRIRSRARASDKLKYVGYIFMGREMQTKTWLTFIERVAQACGGRIEGEIAVTTTRVRASLADRGEIDTPTFVVSDTAAVTTTEA